MSVTRSGAMSIAAAFLLLSATGCVTTARSTLKPDVPVAFEEKTDQRGWWSARFRMKWPANERPSWHVDPFLAQRVVSPVLEQHEQAIGLWRFHRRALRDEKGHQFSFVFYASPSTAREIFRTIASNADLITFKKAGIIEEDTYEDTSSILKTQLEDSSDSRWSPPLKKSWPYFAMGLSQTWLSMIEDLAQQTADARNLTSVDEVLTFYKNINVSVTESWREEGAHAFLHHTNAIFGYEDIAVHERRLTTF